MVSMKVNNICDMMAIDAILLLAFKVSCGLTEYKGGDSIELQHKLIDEMAIRLKSLVAQADQANLGASTQ